MKNRPKWFARPFLVPRSGTERLRKDMTLRSLEETASRPSNIGQCRQWKDIVDRTTHHPLLMSLANALYARNIRSGWWVVRSTISFHWRHCPMFDGLDAERYRRSDDPPSTPDVPRQRIEHQEWMVGRPIDD